ncbi:BrnT family toxin [Brevundimonas staleyi]|uniref:BrnT family toxin n=1 Tax=Brevundimonas staleyi TaxID=74326 RepID=A0ABW0FXK5_9CAUL
MIEFDPDKDAANIAKHGMSLQLANRIDLARAVVIPDARSDYGETRWLAYDDIEARLHVLVFTERGGLIRAISLRKANDREQRFVETKRSSRSTS